jgi:hypothetical protein
MFRNVNEKLKINSCFSLFLIATTLLMWFLPHKCIAEELIKLKCKIKGTEFSAMEAKDKRENQPLIRSLNEVVSVEVKIYDNKSNISGNNTIMISVSSINFSIIPVVNFLDDSVKEVADNSGSNKWSIKIKFNDTKLVATSFISIDRNTGLIKAFTQSKDESGFFYDVKIQGSCDKSDKLMF